MVVYLYDDHLCVWHVYDGLFVSYTMKHVFTIVSANMPPFCNLSLGTNRRGGLYVGWDIFSLDYALPPPGNLMVGGRWGPSIQREAERCSRP